MLSKYRQALLLITGIIYIYSVCPLLCAALEQKLCHSAWQTMENRSACCKKGAGDAENDVETPTESQKLCCGADIELIRQDDNTRNQHKILQIALIGFCEEYTADLLTTQVNSHQLLDSLQRLDDTLYHTVVRRGPPDACS